MTTKTHNLEAKLVLNPDLQAVAEFMEKNISLSNLIEVANNLPLLAQLLWGNGQHGPSPLWLEPHADSGKISLKLAT